MGVTAIDWSVAAVTVSGVEPRMAPDAAVIVLVPVPAAVARPVAVMVAEDVEDVQVSWAVRFWVLLSL